MSKERVNRGGRPKGQVATRAELLRPEHFRLLSAVVQGVTPEAAWTQYMGMEDDPRRGVVARVMEIAEQVMAAAASTDKEAVGKMALEPLVVTLEGSLRRERARLRGPNVEYEDHEPESEWDRARHYGWGEGERDESAPLAAIRLVERTVQGTRSDLDRRVKSLLSLKGALTGPPNARDGLASWMPAELVEKLQLAPATATVKNLPDFVRYLNKTGFNWWREVPGIGRSRGERLASWVSVEAGKLGLKLGQHVFRSPARLALETNVTYGNPGQFMHFGNLAMELSLSGQQGRNRAGTDNTLGALHDVDAVRKLLRTKQVSEPARRAAARSMERVFNWLALIKRKALSDLEHTDMDDYVGFVSSPPVDWIGPTRAKREDEGWRPFCGSLSEGSLATELRTVAGVFQGLVDARYLSTNPCRGLGPEAHAKTRAPSPVRFESAIPSESQVGIETLTRFRSWSSKERNDHATKRAILVFELLNVFEGKAKAFVGDSGWRLERRGGEALLHLTGMSARELDARVVELLDAHMEARERGGIRSPYLIAQVRGGVPKWKPDGRGGSRLELPASRGARINVARARSWAADVARRCSLSLARCGDDDASRRLAEWANWAVRHG